MKARIYRPARTAMQSGFAQTKLWELEFIPSASPFVDPLMGWTGQTDTTQELHLSFHTKDEAIDYAKRNGLDFVVEEPKMRIVRPKSYAANFAYNRID